MLIKDKYNIPNKKIEEMNLLEYLERWRKLDNASTKELSKRIDIVLTKQCKKLLKNAK